MRRVVASLCGIIVVVCAGGASDEDLVRLETENFMNKLKGGWAGQMAGVCFGMPYEWASGCEGFRFTAETITEDLEPWTPDRIHKGFNNDDCYVEISFLEAIEAYGINLSPAQAGGHFATTQFDLWHANLFGRENVRRGIMPPMSGHPMNTLHADDLDFQIEADTIGMICPGLPHESNRLCDIFGHIMCYGDGVYGGMFMAGMYTAAYFEDEDVEAVVKAGLACIPQQALYHKVITDVIRWHNEYPEDWRETWKNVEANYNDNRDCEPWYDASIDAKLNGAYVVIGLLYGAGDFAKTIEIATRCGQDADCNPSNAAGVLGCMKGIDGIPAIWTSGLADVTNEKFSFTNHTFDSLMAACQTIAEEIIVHAGGKIEGESYLIPRQSPRPPETLEQWVNQDSLYWDNDTKKFRDNMTTPMTRRTTTIYKGKG